MTEDNKKRRFVIATLAVSFLVASGGSVAHAAKVAASSGAGSGSSSGSGSSCMATSQSQLQSDLLNAPNQPWCFFSPNGSTTLLQNSQLYDQHGMPIDGWAADDGGYTGWGRERWNYTQTNAQLVAGLGQGTYTTCSGATQPLPGKSTPPTIVFTVTAQSAVPGEGTWWAIGTDTSTVAPANYNSGGGRAGTGSGAGNAPAAQPGHLAFPVVRYDDASYNAYLQYYGVHHMQCGDGIDMTGYQTGYGPYTYHPEYHGWVTHSQYSTTSTNGSGTPQVIGYSYSIEQHNFPHINICNKAGGCGYETLCSQVQGTQSLQYQCTMFEFPYGTGVYLPPNTWHTNEHFGQQWGNIIDGSTPPGGNNTPGGIVYTTFAATDTDAGSGWHQMRQAQQGSGVGTSSNRLAFDFYYTDGGAAPPSYNPCGLSPSFCPLDASVEGKSVVVVAPSDPEAAGLQVDATTGGSNLIADQGTNFYMIPVYTGTNQGPQGQNIPDAFLLQDLNTGLYLTAQGTSVVLASDNGSHTNDVWIQVRYGQQDDDTGNIALASFGTFNYLHFEFGSGQVDLMAGGTDSVPAYLVTLKPPPR